MLSLMDLWESYSHLLAFAAIPVINAVVGWGTNWLAIKMTFYPIEFVGIKPVFGWQGIVPSKATKMAEKCVDLITSKLLDVKALFSQIEPKRVAQDLQPMLDRMMRETVHEVMEKEAPLMWMATPNMAKEVIFKRSMSQIPEVAEEMMADIRDNIDEFLDVKGMVVEHLTAEKSLMNEIFLRCGAEEFKFIERSGLYFGFLFGMIQAIIWYFVNPWWLLPVGGIFVGWATNWLALKMIFNPKDEISILGMKFQGLFIKRQIEVSTEYAKIITVKVLTVERMFERIFRGNASDKLIGMLHEHVKDAIDTQAGLSKSIYQVFAGRAKYDELKDMAADRFVTELPISIQGTFEYAHEALDLETTMREKMIALTPTDFEGVLRPAFQEDEWILILVGAVLGGLAGATQLILLFS